MKKYENPMLQVVSISKNDIIVTSPNLTGTYDGGAVLDGGRRFDDFDAGY